MGVTKPGFKNLLVLRRFFYFKKGTKTVNE